MPLFRELHNLSVIHLSFLFLITIFLAPLNIKNPASVSAAERSDDYPGSDYPSYDEMLKVFTPPGKDNSIFWSDFRDLPDTDVEPARFASFVKKKWLFDCFPRNSDGTHYLEQNGRSREWYTHFAGQATMMYIEFTEGDVFLLSRWPKGPREDFPQCSHWHDFEFPLLQENLAVETIFLVNVRDYKKRKPYWSRDDEPKNDEGNQPDTPGDGNGDGESLPEGESGQAHAWNGMLGAQSAVLGALGALTGTAALDSNAAAAGLGGSIGNGLSGVDGLGLVQWPDSQTPKAKKQDSSLITDPLDAIMGELPPADDPSTTTREDAVIAGTDTSSYPPGISRRSRHRRALLPRFNTKCWDWDGWPTKDIPSGPDTVGIQGQRDDSLHVAIPYPAAAAGSVTVRVTQHQKASPSANYVLDITVLDPVNQVMADRRGVVAPAGIEQKIEIAGLSIPLFVWTGDDDSFPLFYRYGLNLETWDSNDGSEDGHRCRVDPWAGGKRTLTCMWKY